MNIEEKLNFKTLEWRGDHLRLLDQTRLPSKLEYYDCREIPDFIDAIKRLVVRGAPAIGIAAGYAMVLASMRGDDLESTAADLVAARPTAVNLAWAVNRMMTVAREQGNDPVLMEKEAILIHNEDAEMCRQMGKLGSSLIKSGMKVLTHCNAGALATGGIGTALAAIYAAHFEGKRISVWVDETRPLLQGARITSWELGRAGVPYTLICDNMAASLMARKSIDCALVGADRIASNYDVANKIGTYNAAVLCSYHKIPFYVAAPSSTFDYDCPNGESIVIENREDNEVTAIGGWKIAPGNAHAYNPAFDITPHYLITAIITEKEIIKP